MAQLKHASFAELDAKAVITPDLPTKTLQDVVK